MNKYLNYQEGILKFITSKSYKFILKGGFALYYCYGSERVTIDLDFDCQIKGLNKLVVDYCLNNGLEYNIKKDSDSKQKILVNIKLDKGRKLKIEGNLKNSINAKSIILLNNIITYDLETMLLNKLKAYKSRYVLRDIYDISFLINTYWSSFSSNMIEKTKETLLERGGLNNIDYLLSLDISEEFITKDETLISALKLFERLGIS